MTLFCSRLLSLRGADPQSNPRPPIESIRGSIEGNLKGREAVRPPYWLLVIYQMESVHFSFDL